MPYIDFSSLTPHRSETSGGEQRYNCPLCTDTKGRLYLNSSKGRWFCFNCSRGGTTNDKVPTPIASVKPKMRECKTKTHINSLGAAYLKAHHICPNFAWEQGVRSGAWGMEGRLIFPARFRTGTGKITTFESAHATMADISPKALGFGTKTFAVYGSHVPQSEEIELPDRTHLGVLVEGPADALRLATYWQGEDLSAVCMFGKTLKDKEIFHLTKLFKNFYVMLDRPRNLSGRDSETVATNRLMDALSVFASGYVMSHQWYRTDVYAKDPADLNDPDLEQLSIRLRSI